MGFLFAFLTSILHAVNDGIRKKITLITNEYLAFWGLTLFVLPIFILVAVFIGLGDFKPNFWYILPINLCSNFMATLLLFKALRISPLSLTIPYLAFSPVFLLLVGWITLREFPNFYGLGGVILITLGGYLLNSTGVENGLLSPWRAIKKEKGSLYALIVSFLYAVGASLDKIAVRNSSPIGYLLVFHVIMLIIVSVVILLRYGRATVGQSLRKSWSSLLLGGLVAGLALIFQMLSIQKILVVYTIAIKRTGLVLAVIIGHFFFKEKDFLRRLIYASVMAVGVLMITLLN